MKDYVSYRPAAVKLAQKIRAYWNSKGYEPEIVILESSDGHGQKIYSIRSDAHTTGPIKMSKFVKPR